MVCGRLGRVGNASEKQSQPSSRFGNLWVFWPAFLSWGSVAAYLACCRPRVWETLPTWAPRAAWWTTLGLAILAAAGAVFVSLRTRVARHWFPVLLNLSTIWWAYVAVSCAVFLHRVDVINAEFCERQRALDEELEAIEEMGRSIEERAKRRRESRRTR